MTQDVHQAGASVGTSEPDDPTNAAARARMVSEEHFERWWKNHAIRKRAKEDGHLALLSESYREVARAAWLNGAGYIQNAHRDERIERLEERAQFLRNKIFNNRPAESARAKAELSALEWAIPIVMRATGLGGGHAVPSVPEPNKQDAVREPQVDQSVLHRSQGV